MSSAKLSTARVYALKSALRRDYSEIKSSHLSEALAFSLGFKTHAALKTDMDHHEESDAPYVLLNEQHFIHKLQEFGYLEDDDGWFSFDDYKDQGVIKTEPLSSLDIEYKTKREKAWRNLMVLTINMALEKKLFSLRPGDNRWEGWKGIEHEHRNPSKGYCFDFELPSGKLILGYVNDASFDELSIHAAVNPNSDWVKAHNAGFHAGDAFATGWLERQTGAWLQSSTSSFNCRKHLLNELVNLDVTPSGYGDKGRVIM